MSLCHPPVTHPGPPPSAAKLSASRNSASHSKHDSKSDQGSTSEQEQSTCKLSLTQREGWNVEIPESHLNITVKASWSTSSNPPSALSSSATSLPALESQSFAFGENEVIHDDYGDTDGNNNTPLVSHLVQQTKNLPFNKTGTEPYGKSMTKVHSGGLRSVSRSRKCSDDEILALFHNQHCSSQESGHSSDTHASSKNYQGEGGGTSPLGTFTLGVTDCNPADPFLDYDCTSSTDTTRFQREGNDATTIISASEHARLFSGLYLSPNSSHDSATCDSRHTTSSRHRHSATGRDYATILASSHLHKALDDMETTVALRSQIREDINAMVAQRTTSLSATPTPKHIVTIQKTEHVPLAAGDASLPPPMTSLDDILQRMITRCIHECTTAVKEIRSKILPYQLSTAQGSHLGYQHSPSHGRPVCHQCHQRVRLPITTYCNCRM